MKREGPIKVLLGVTGGIAAIKAPLVASALVKAGLLVDTVLTQGAEVFVKPLPLAALTGRPVHRDRDFFKPDGAIRHVELAREAEAALVAPASASFLARLAAGASSDLLVATLLGLRGPLVLAPAMETEMWTHPAVQGNMALLEARGAIVVGPAKGRLASGAEGEGRMEEPDLLVGALLRALHPKDLVGKTVLVTAGPTREHLDDVRFLTNASTGRMGFALAEAALMRGARVQVVFGPTPLTPPPGCEAHAVVSTEEMLQAVQSLYPGADILVAAAAPADWRPAHREAGKPPKADYASSLGLLPTPDILGWAGKEKTHQVLIGFAAHSGPDEKRALQKLGEKHLDLVVLNDVMEKGAGFASSTNHVYLLGGKGFRREAFGQKLQVAHAIFDAMRELLA